MDLIGKTKMDSYDGARHQIGAMSPCICEPAQERAVKSLRRECLDVAELPRHSGLHSEVSTQCLATAIELGGFVLEKLPD